MGVEEELLRDAHERPDEDGPRLVLADWLQDQPDPARQARGELIRVQCELESLTTWDPRRFELLVRQDVLLQEHGDEWLSMLPWSACDFRHIPTRWTCRRGLLRLVRLDLEGNWFTRSAAQELRQHFGQRVRVRS